MTCENINNCPGETLSSNCIVWQGSDIACLNIVKGQSITELENAVATKVCTLLTNVDLSTVTLCDELIALMADKDKTIANLFQTLIDYSCTLKELIDSFTGNSENNPLTLDYKCLDVQLDPCNPTQYNLQNILQILINNFCDLKTAFTQLNTEINTTINNSIFSSLSDTLQTCQTNRIQSNPLTKKITLRGFVPPYCPIAYVGPLDYFDSSGKGLDNGPMCGWYLCNGNNSTPDYRGRVLVGVVQGISGGTLSAEVDPTLPKNAGANYALGDTGGEVTHRLTTSEMPSHNHPLNDPGHIHNLNNFDMYLGGPSSGGAGGTNIGVQGVTRPNIAILSHTTGITVGNRGDNAYHENRMPYKAVNYIMMLT